MNRMTGQRRGPPSMPPLARSWERQSWPLRILRAFLGLTFVYAGVQKFADPNFLHGGTPDYIGSQLEAFARGSPIGPLLQVLVHLPVLTGILIALVEIAVGLATLLGVAPRAAAATGFAINLTLFLSATWHVHPYFLGSDSIYAVAWLAYVVGIVEVDHRAARALATHGSRRKRGAAARKEIGRREFIRGALVGVGTLALGMVGSFLEGKPARPLSVASAGTVGKHHRSTGAAATTRPASTGTTITSLDHLPVGEAIGFDDPTEGPSVLLRLAQDRVAAYSRTCTHAGCLVGYDPRSRLLVCPCHGAEFDPARGAEPVAGPAPTALPEIRVSIDTATGQIVAQD